MPVLHCDVGFGMLRNDFKLEVDWIKALPPGEETDIVLISCVGATFTGAEREKVAQAKRCERFRSCAVSTSFRGRSTPDGAEGCTAGANDGYGAVSAMPCS